MTSTSPVQDYVKIFLVSLVTSVAVLFLLGPVMMRLQAPAGPREQAEAPTQPTAAPTEATPAAGAQMTAPNLQGLDLREARERWRAQGIVIIEDSQRVDTTVEAGTILSQIPSGGAPLQTKEIRVVVAAAPEMVTVPSVIGKAAEDATESLVEAGFEVPTPEQEASTEALGTVLRQEPNAGSKSEKGSLVRLVVSGEVVADAGADINDGGDGGEAGEAGDTSEASAPEATVEVPRLTGQSLNRARSKLEKLGLSVGAVREREDEELSSQRVLSQSPSAGTKVIPGTAVDLVIVAPD